MNDSRTWLERNWSQHEVLSNFLSDFLIILWQQKTSYERNDILILFSFWLRMMLSGDNYENQNIYFLLKIVFSPNSAFYLKDNKWVNMIQYISIL